MKLSKLTIVDQINKEVNQKYDFLTEQTVRIESMCQDYDDLVEYHKVIESIQNMVSGELFKEVWGRIESMSERDNQSEIQSVDHEEAKQMIERNVSECSSERDYEGVNVGKVVGTWMNKDLLRLKQLVFRSTRGNALVISKNEDGVKGFKKKILQKSIFIVIFQEGNALRHKIEAVALNFSKTLFKIPNRNVIIKLNKIQGKIDQTKQLIKLSISNLK